MTFREVLAQIIEWLQQDKRVSYRALKMQFDLDDEYLEVLKEELIDVQQVAVDQDGRMLVWTGEAVITPESVSPASQPAQQVATQEAQPPKAEPPPPKPPTPDAERRQLTVMFCDLVGSTPLSEQLDPEDLREVVRAYQQTCAEVIQRFDGHIAQLLGDALLVYFGWPQAHEDDAQRAGRTGLGMLEAMGMLNTRLEQEKGIRLAIRVGIHTGLVVVGEMGGGGHQEQLALGDTPNVASRLQGLAEPDTVVISEATYRLLEGYFTVDGLGLHTLKGVAEPQQVYRVLSESGAQSRLDIARARGLTPLVGRELEVTLLLDRWTQVKDRQGQVVILSGEGGIGKSRLVQVLKDHVASEPHIRWECRSSPYYQNTALYPLTDLFQRTLQWQPEDAADDKLATLERMLSQYRLGVEETVPLFAPLLSLPLPEERYPLRAVSPQRQRQKTLEAILAIVLELSEHQPVLFILEDLHWTDPTTLEFLDLLIDQIPTASIVTLLTCRPAFQPTWRSHSYLTQVTLNRLSRKHIERMAHQVAGGKGLPVEVVQQIVEKTDGVPLFVEEMTKAVLESGYLKETNGRYELTGSLPSLAIPATLQDSLMARLDRLVSAKGIAQLGATIGRQFSYEVLQSVSQVDEATLQRELERLVQAEFLYRRGLPPHATYSFKHALIRDAAYASLLKSTKQQYHQQIAQVFEACFPATQESQPELLAHHYTEAGLNKQAISYWQQAGEQAIQRSANVEAIAHLTKGLALLTTLPDTIERAQHELTLQLALGVPLQATKGYAAPERGEVYTRAWELCQQIGETSQRFPVLFGLWQFYNMGGELQTSREVAEQLLSLARHQDDPALLLEVHRALGLTLLNLGELVPARELVEQGIALYDPLQHRAHAFLYGQDPGMTCRVYTALVLWLLGYADQARARSHEAITLARELAHPYSLAMALGWAARLHLCCRDVQGVSEHAEALMTLSTEQGFPTWVAHVTVLRGWALAAQERGEEGIAQMRQGMAAFRAIGAVLWATYDFALLAEAYKNVGHVKAGLDVLAEALTLVDKTGYRYWEAELYRHRGHLVLWRGAPDERQAETYFHKALSIARNQQAKSLELRAATSVARLWQSQDRRQDAYDLLAPVYGWFTEGFDTADLQEAKTLLQELA